MAFPTISAIIPTYNRAQYITAAIDSVIAQTHPVDEIVVVDDGSTDNTSQLLRRYGDTVRVVEQRNAGAAVARNRGMREARGDIFAFLDSDDIWLPGKTDLQCSFLRQNPYVEFVFGDMSNFTGEPSFSVPEIKSWPIHNYLAANARNVPDLLSCLIVENVVPTPTVMISRQAVRRIGRFDETLEIAEDLDYWLRAARHCRCGFINRVLVARRRHESNLVANTNLRNACMLRVLSKLESEIPKCEAACLSLIRQKTKAISDDLGSALLKSRRYRDAREHLRRVHAGGNRSFKLRLKLATATVLARIFTAVGADVRRDLHTVPPQ